jgi:hypothetical protein
MQELLFDQKILGYPKRPINDFDNDELFNLCFNKIKRRLLAWLKEFENEKGIKSIKEQFKDSIEYDGYLFAKNLEDNFYWSPDSNLVDICEDFISSKYSCFSALENKWVKTNGIKPIYNIGDVVIYKSQPMTIESIDIVSGRYRLIDGVYANYEDVKQ